MSSSPTPFNLIKLEDLASAREPTEADKSEGSSGLPLDMKATREDSSASDSTLNRLWDEVTGDQARAEAASLPGPTPRPPCAFQLRARR